MTSGETKEITEIRLTNSTKASGANILPAFAAFFLIVAAAFLVITFKDDKLRLNMEYDITVSFGFSCSAEKEKQKCT